jgi:hypothetical protein
VESELDIDKQMRIFLLVVSSLFVGLGVFGCYLIFTHQTEIIGMILGLASIYIVGQCFIYYAQTLES